MPIPETVMIEKCSGCASRPNTDASNSPYTSTLFQICVMVGEPFECHDSGGGHLCRGFVDAFTAKLKKGDYERMPEWRKQLLHNLIDVLGDLRTAHNRDEVFDFDEAIRKAVGSTATFPAPLQPPSPVSQASD